jgi:hypothetical protein
MLSTNKKEHSGNEIAKGIPGKPTRPHIVGFQFPVENRLFWRWPANAGRDAALNYRYPCARLH